MKKIYAVGIGPGSYEDMTIRARDVLEACDVIVGYTVYIDLVKEHFPQKEFLTTPMRREVDRCELAFAQAELGRSVAVICSGDAGVYGMSGLMEELAPRHPGVEVETVAGVSAVISGAALLGAPLMHDFAVISLSDLLTPWEKIENRLLCAAQADFVICLYNPASHKRRDYLSRACELVLRFAGPETVCGIVRSIGREGQSVSMMTLSELKDAQADMFSTVFIGNSQTRSIGGRMVTPRGYSHE